LSFTISPRVRSASSRPSSRFARSIRRV
jgi:hypothetical protein